MLCGFTSMKQTEKFLKQWVNYTEQEIEALYFDNKAELGDYAESYAAVPLDFYGNLCECKIVILPEV